MVVCLCKGVSDKKIRWLVQNGASSLREVMATCHAGRDCGTCVCAVKEVIEKDEPSCRTTSKTFLPPPARACGPQ